MVFFGADAYSIPIIGSRGNKALISEMAFSNPYNK